ncbi:MAG: CBS domain containing membrane protein [Candidatus Levybacteria bacterium GW2011_GWA2_40_8]|nr:MAG: CBS domain containing membrane protein [Candidatus Levybacteria bacterium GW2011_GWA2_40_8]
MKVKDAMSKKVDYVFTKSKVKNISKLIFIHQINGVPVLSGKRVIGFITERDILAKFFPSIQEYIEDPVNTSNFEKMERKISEIFDLTADKIMSKRLVTIEPDAPILRAQSLMLSHKVGRLPVVDKRGNLIGIISKGDIFKALVGKRLHK